MDAAFTGLIDVKDLQGRPETQQRDGFLTRCLAAFCVRALAECDPRTAGASITDSYDDQGIDAIYFDSNERVIYLVQAKWSYRGNSTIELGDFEKFLVGVRLLISGEFADFGSKIKRREPEIQDVLDRSDVKVVLVLAYSSHNPIGSHIATSLNRFIAAQNEGVPDIFRSELFDLARLHSQLLDPSSVKIDIQMTLVSWGRTNDPYLSYYGRVSAPEVATWAKHGKHLFDRNIRYYRPTEINDAIQATLGNFPKHFWYFNNGITILCKSVAKTLEGLERQDYGTFDCKGCSIVNGAQTVGVIWELAGKDESFISSSQAWVQVRLISLEKCPEGFGTDVTKAANTQNSIRHRDFAATDPEQQRLAEDMAHDQKRYAYKSGDPDPKNGDGCNIEEATVALACANEDITLAVQAKREVGQLWQDIKKAPYTTLFNGRLSAANMWRAVRVMRVVEKSLALADKGSVPRGGLVAVHGNRFILHRVFMDPSMRNYRDPKVSENDIVIAAESATYSVFKDLAILIYTIYPNDYLANLFKNANKNKTLDDVMSKPKDPTGQQQPGLFENL